MVYSNFFYSRRSLGLKENTPYHKKIVIRTFLPKEVSKNKKDGKCLKTDIKHTHTHKKDQPEILEGKVLFCNWSALESATQFFGCQ